MVIVYVMRCIKIARRKNRFTTTSSATMWRGDASIYLHNDDEEPSIVKITIE